MTSIAEPPKYFRAPKATGGAPRVNRSGGYSSEGVINQVSVITKGEALGHDLWIDDVFLDQVSDGINVRNKGVKSRFTHPSLSGDGLGKFVGRVRDADVSDGKVIADQHFSRAGHKTPDGDLAEWLMTMAEDDPDAYGLSIVFDIDGPEMRKFRDENVDDEGRFISPDPENKHNFPHARLSQLVACDAVDSPAANPDGLFHRENEIIEQANALAEFATGLTDDAPSCVALGLDSDRVRGFVARFLKEHDMTLSIADQPEVAGPDDDNSELSLTEGSSDNDSQTAGNADSDTGPSMASKPEGQRFLDAFGDQGGVWFAQGLSFADAQAEYTKSLAERVDELADENEKLKQRLSGVTAGETDPIEVSPNQLADGKQQKRGTLEDLIRRGGNTKQRV